MYYIVETCHSGRKNIWFAENKERVIEIANLQDDFYYYLENDGELVVYNDGFEINRLPKDDAPCEFEAACEFLAHDLQSFNLMTRDECQEYIDLGCFDFGESDELIRLMELTSEHATN